MAFVVDTNVPIVANGGDRGADGGSRRPSVECRLRAIEFLERLLQGGRIVLDLGGEIEAEYRRYLHARGQPGVGDRFYQEVLNSAPKRVQRIQLDKSGEDFDDFPSDPRLATFDRSDRKFVAASRKSGAPIANATDSDWLDHREALEANGVTVEYVCGCDRGQWFEARQ
ncbi:MAG: hypothetical protein ACLPKB_06970 [Xanthobacteraceae bacterium]